MPPYPMKGPYGGMFDFPGKEMYEQKMEDPVESKHSEENGKEGSQDTINDEAEIAKAVKEELDATNILKGLSINESSIVDTKLGKALNKFIQIYAPNHIDSILKSRANLHNIS